MLFIYYLEMVPVEAHFRAIILLKFVSSHQPPCVMYTSSISFIFVSAVTWQSFCGNAFEPRWRVLATGKGKIRPISSGSRLDRSMIQRPTLRSRITKFWWIYCRHRRMPDFQDCGRQSGNRTGSNIVSHVTEGIESIIVIAVEISTLPIHYSTWDVITSRCDFDGRHTALADRHLVFSESIINADSVVTQFVKLSDCRWNIVFLAHKNASNARYHLAGHFTFSPSTREDVAGKRPMTDQEPY